jgi:hypothetical protein
MIAACFADEMLWLVGSFAFVGGLLLGGPGSLGSSGARAP